jgi:hypothetical protein
MVLSHFLKIKKVINMNLISQNSFLKAIIAVALVAPALSHAGVWRYNLPQWSFSFATLKAAQKYANEVNSTRCLSNRGERIFAGSQTKLPIGTRSMCTSAPVVEYSGRRLDYVVREWEWVVR